MTPEELAYQTNFVYPLILLLIGGGITTGLIPFFNRLHVNKLRKLEQEREEVQKRLDRQREDHRFELEIKANLVSQIANWIAKNIIAIQKLHHLEDMNESNKKKIFLDQSFESIAEFTKLLGLIKLYYENPEIVSQISNLFNVGLSLSQLAFVKDEKQRIQYSKTIFNNLDLSTDDEKFQSLISDPCGTINDMVGVLGKRTGDLFNLINGTIQKKSYHD